MRKIFSIVSFCAALFSMNGFVFAADQTFTSSGWSGRTMMSGWDIMAGWSAIDWFWMLAWYLMAVAIIVLGVRWLVNTRHMHISHRSSLEILKERYAKGELNKEHFEEMRKELLK